MRRIMITGGYGFIGSNLVRYWLDKYPDDTIICLDSLTYAARPEWVLEKVRMEGIGPRFSFMNCDITQLSDVRSAMNISCPDHVIHLAAESHVCRSINGPSDFMSTNFIGTFNVLEAFKELWIGRKGQEFHRFHHVSTDEVYGVALGDSLFNEKLKYDPRSPYAASKASSDHLVSAWHHTYGLDTVITNCSNNYGPNQHEEKLIPKVIYSLFNRKPMTVYGPGTQVRDWLYVEDHCRAIDHVFHMGLAGETYCVGGEKELTNIAVIHEVVKAASEVLSGISPEVTLQHTDDRPTDDARYAIDTSKLRSIGWRPRPDLFERDLQNTVAWYAERILGSVNVQKM